jgi:hypothetical protein
MKTRESFKFASTSRFGTSTAWAPLCLALCILGLGLPANAREAIITTFDVPGAAATLPIYINPGGVITGEFVDNTSFAFHGFLRSHDGGITTFDAPGAGTVFPEGTMGNSINPGGAITGSFVDVNGVYHGFLRTRQGTITEFDVLGAGTGSGQGTATHVGNSINAARSIAGTYTDSDNVFHGFLRTPDGATTTFDAPGASATGPGQEHGTVVSGATGINQVGEITGWYFDANGAYHPFLRATDSGITTFDAPGAGHGAGQGTLAVATLPSRLAAGLYQDSSLVNHGFVRAPDGTITTFDVASAGTAGTQGTLPQDINPAGAITGYYIDTNNVEHGFLRTSNGTITAFDPPGAGMAAGQGTFAVGINPAGAITGTYVDGSGVLHGFIRNP